MSGVLMTAEYYLKTSSNLLTSLLLRKKTLTKGHHWKRIFEFLFPVFTALISYSSAVF